MKIKFIAQAARWFERTNGNTYHSVRVTRCSDGKTIVGLFPPYEYGYGECYRQTALKAMSAAKWIPPAYRGKSQDRYENPLSWKYERENDYPIYWIVADGTKREMIANGTL